MSAHQLTGVITGDIIQSRQADPETWLNALKRGLAQWGSEPVDWAIYRGDSFTCVVPAEDTLRAALHLKAVLIGQGGVDARIGMGIGEVAFRAERATESQGTAFERSGAAFECLRKATMKLRTADASRDAEWDALLGLAMRAADHWTASSAAAMEVALADPERTQGEWAERLGKSQSTTSEALKRAAHDELVAMIRYIQASL